MMTEITNGAEHQNALDRIDALWDSEEGTAEAAELVRLSILVEAYEDIHYPIRSPAPVEVIRFRMEAMDLEPSDVADCFGGVKVVEDVLAGRAGLTLPMAEAVHIRLGIPLRLLVKDTAKSKPVENDRRRRLPSGDAQL